MKTVLELLLDWSGNCCLGDLTSDLETPRGGLFVAEAVRITGDKCQVGVKYIDDLGRYEVLYDPNANKGGIRSIEGIYLGGGKPTETPIYTEASNEEYAIGIETPEPVFELAGKPEPETEAEVKSEPEPEPETEAEVKSEPEPEPEPVKKANLPKKNIPKGGNKK